MIKLTDWGYYVSKNFFKEEKTTLREVIYYEIELYKTENGISIINGVEYPHKKGNILIAFPGDKRQSIHSFECHSVKFSLNEDEDIKKYLNAGVSNIIETSGCETVFNDIYRAAAESFPGKELYIDAKIRRLTAEIYNITNTYSTNRKFSEYAKNIYESTEFIKNNCHKNLSLNDMAKTANLSPAFFHRVFKSIAGKTPWEMLTEQRIKNARLFLENTDISIDNIAVKCGFSTRQYFDTVFKKRTGKTPAGYRKDIKRII